jgi:hypothetical protein
MSRKTGFGLSIEELQDDDVIMDGDTPIVDDSFIVNDEVSAAASDVDVLEDAIDQVQDISEGLETIRDNIALCLKNGGMNRQTAEMAKLAIKATEGRWARRSNMPSMESFEESGGRMSATGYALEDVKEKLKYYWGKVVTFIKNWIAKIALFINKHASSAGFLSKSAKSLAAKAEKHTGKPGDAIKMSPSQYVKLLKDNSIANIPANLSALVPIIKSGGKGGWAIEFVKAATAQIKAFPTETDKIEAWYAEFKSNDTVDTLPAVLSNSVIKYHSSVDSRYTSGKTEKYYISSESFIGNKKSLVQFSFNNEDINTGVSCSLINIDDSKKFDNDEYEVASLNKTEIANLCKRVAEVADAINVYKVNVVARKKEIDELIKAGDKAVSNVTKIEEKGDVPAGSKGVRFMKTLIPKISGMALTLVKADSIFQTLGLESAKAAYAYASSSYSNLKK